MESEYATIQNLLTGRQSRRVEARYQADLEKRDDRWEDVGTHGRATEPCRAHNPPQQVFPEQNEAPHGTVPAIRSETSSDRTTRGPSTVTGAT